MMRRHLFIVSRETPHLAQYMREQFRDEPDVEVIVDRRRHTTHGVTNGMPERRVRHDIERELRESFHVFVTSENGVALS